MIIGIGCRIKQLRIDNGLQQEQVAKLANVERSTISLWENDLRQPSFVGLVRLADVFGVTTDYLLGRTDSRSLDISGLTADEAAMVSQLVASMTAKNHLLEQRGVKRCVVVKQSSLEHVRS